MTADTPTPAPSPEPLTKSDLYWLDRENVVTGSDRDAHWRAVDKLAARLAEVEREREDLRERFRRRVEDEDAIKSRLEAEKVAAESQRDRALALVEEACSDGERWCAICNSHQHAGTCPHFRNLRARAAAIREGNDGD